LRFVTGGGVEPKALHTN